MSNVTPFMKKNVQNLEIQRIKKLATFLIQVAFVVDEVVDVSSSIPTNQMVQAFPHFWELSFPALKEKVDLLLGCNLHQAYVSKKILIREPGSPSGLHTSLEWTIYGRDESNQKLLRNPQIVVNFMITAEHNAESRKQLLDVLEQDFRNCDEYHEAID